MLFEEAWRDYDFTEAEVIGMQWQLPLHYVLRLNYYWDLSAANTAQQIAQNDQFVNVIFQQCIYLNLQFGHSSMYNADNLTFGTIVGWGRETPSRWLQQRQLDPSEWLHLFFDVGANSRLDIICRRLVIERH